MGFADYPFRSRYLEVNGSRIHYIDEGSGPTLLFLHGNPTSSYLWRNVIKPLRDQYRCVAPDLIGFGQSDRPDIDYRFATHYDYIEAFVSQLGLENVTLVLHDWGGPIGFQLAQREPERVRALCFMETFPFTMEWSEFPWMAQPLFRAFRTERVGRMLVMRQNLFINLVLPMGVMRSLPRSVMAAYRAPFRHWRERYPIYVWPNELPIGDRRGETWKAIHRIEENLSEMAQPMLLLTFRPGALIPAMRVNWLAGRIPDLETTDCGRGLHYVQEDHPRDIAGAIRDWLKRRRLYNQDHETPTRRVQASTDRPEPAAAPAVHESARLTGPVQWLLQENGNTRMLMAWSSQGLVLRSPLAPEEDPQTLLEQEFPRARPERIADSPPASPDNPHQPLHLVGTPFQRRVWKTLLEVPSGTRVNYAELAHRLDTAPRALGQAVGRNRIAEWVPCHRVVPSEGGVGNYRWGSERKKALLEREGSRP